MKDELGGKGAGLAEMTNAGLPVPPGFTIQTEACRESMRGKISPRGRSADATRRSRRLEQLQGQKLGAGENPLLVSVRSGAKFSMPGMMDTILNLGLNDETRGSAGQAQPTIRASPTTPTAGFIQMFGNVVLEIPKPHFDEVFDGTRRSRRRPSSTPNSTPRRCRKSSPNTRRWSRSTPSATFRRTRTSSW